ncbi:MAG: ATP-binding protein [Oscillospiraceae bacterium]|nr:ATP-binding protein [Oscillospiraceae bacterium]
MEFSKGINLLIGKNGVGKTHLLKLLYTYAVAKFSKYETVFGVEKGYMKINFYDSISVSYSISKVFPDLVFIPANEMLTHAKGLLSMKEKYGENMPFDDTLLDIIKKAQAWKLKEMPEIAKNIAPIIENIIGGVVEVKDDGSFWVKKSNGDVIPFSMEADGFKRLGLIWQLIMNESISENSVILWDEPEASINPENIPVLVDIMLELQRHGVQIIAATHSYNLMKYLSVKRKKEDNASFFSLYKTENGTAYEREEDYDLLENNSIVEGEIKLLEAEIEGAL